MSEPKTPEQLLVDAVLHMVKERGAAATSDALRRLADKISAGSLVLAILRGITLGGRR